MTDVAPETPPPADDAARTVWPLPDRRHLVLLAIGAAVGVLLGPLVLGQISPSTFEALFTGDTQRLVELERELERIDEQREQIVRIAAESDVTPVATSEALERLQDREGLIRATLRSELRRVTVGDAWAMVLALTLALVVVGIFEAVVSPTPGRRGRALLTPVQPRVTTIRYALLAGLLAIVLARPALLAEVSWAFVALLLAVIAVAGFVPLSGRRSTDA